jgi:hypothetical protein
MYNSRLTLYSYAHYHTGTVAEPPISINGRAMGGTRAKNMLGSISQREEELNIRSAEIYDGEQRLVAAHAELEERLSAITAREQHDQQREEAVQKREEAIQQREQSVHQHEQAVQQGEQALQQRGQAIQQREQAIAERETAIAAREHNNYEREQAFAAFEEGMLRQLEGNYTSITSTVSQMRRAVGNAQGILANRRQQVLYHENFSNSVQGTHGQGKCGRSSIQMSCGLHMEQADMAVLLPLMALLVLWEDWIRCLHRAKSTFTPRSTMLSNVNKLVEDSLSCHCNHGS